MQFSEQIKSLVSSTYFAFMLFLTSLFGVFFVFTATNPADLGATGMLVAFGVFYICFAALFLVLLHVLRSLFVRRQPKTDNEYGPQLNKLSLGKLYTIAATFAFAPVIAMALRSIGQLDAMSTILVALFEVIAVFYILKR